MASYGGDFGEADTYRVIQVNPVPDLQLGYVYTQNGSDAKYMLKERLIVAESKGFEFLNPSGAAYDFEDPENPDFQLALRPDQSDLILLFQVEDQSSIAFRSQVELRQKTKEELRKETKEAGASKPIADSDATIRTLSTPNNYSILVENGTDKGTALDIVFNFTKENFKIEGQPENQAKLSLSIPPGGEEFILFEKVDKNA